jgi:hypothetical protein
MAEYYTKEQSDQQAAGIGARIKTATSAAAIAAALAASTVPDHNLITEAERTKLAGLESSKFLGTFADLASIPVVGAVAGSYADIDGGVGATTMRAIFDVDDGKFRLQQGAIAGETSESIKTKYEANANTNAFTDPEKQKLAELIPAASNDDYFAALDAALA